MKMGGVDVLIHIPPTYHTPPSYIQAMAVAVWWCGVSSRRVTYISLTYIHIYVAYARNVAQCSLYDICVTGVER